MGCRFLLAALQMCYLQRCRCVTCSVADVLLAALQTFYLQSAADVYLTCHHAEKEGTTRQHRKEPRTTGLPLGGLDSTGTPVATSHSRFTSTEPRDGVNGPAAAAAAGPSGVGGISSGLLLRTIRQLTACTRSTGKSSNFPLLLKER